MLGEPIVRLGTAEISDGGKPPEWLGLELPPGACSPAALLKADRALAAAVEVHIDASLWSIGEPIDLACACAHLSTMLERFQLEQPLEQWEQHGPSRRLFSRLHSLATELDARTPLPEQLDALGLLQLFPVVSAVLRIPARSNPDAYGDYLGYMTTLNQLVSMTQQLRDDIVSGNTHKYMAHQVALLYVSVATVAWPLALPVVHSDAPPPSCAPSHAPSLLMCAHPHHPCQSERPMPSNCFAWCAGASKQPLTDGCNLSAQQCLNQIKSPVANAFKKRIEPHFDSIKQASP